MSSARGWLYLQADPLSGAPPTPATTITSTTKTVTNPDGITTTSTSTSVQTEAGTIQTEIQMQQERLLHKPDGTVEPAGGMSLTPEQREALVKQVCGLHTHTL